jgi:hypothetical protein
MPSTCKPQQVTSALSTTTAQLTNLLLDRRLSWIRWQLALLFVLAHGRWLVGTGADWLALRCYCLALFERNLPSAPSYLVDESFSPHPFAPSMPFHELHDIQRRTQLLLTSIAKIILDLERPSISTHISPQLLKSVRRGGVSWPVHHA